MDEAAVTDDPLVYLNGSFTPLSQAKIPVLDRGFIFGDGVYEVVPFYQRMPFRGPQHLARLARSLEAIGIANPHTNQEWLTLIAHVVAAHPADNQLVYLQVTRGVARRMHAFPLEATPTVFIMSHALTLPSADMRAQGVACVTIEDQRWQRCDIKSISLLGNVLAAQYAAEQQATEAIQLRDDFLTEGASSNIWVVKDGIVSGPPRDHRILEGIRYRLIEELCAAQAIAFRERPIHRDALLDADEVLLSSAGRELLPVTCIDGKPVANGRPGPIYEALYAAYQAVKPARKSLA